MTFDTFGLLQVDRVLRFKAERKVEALPMVKKWAGELPEKCDLCRGPLRVVFFDCATTAGPWGILCRGCFMFHGVGLGTGRGQKYDAQTGVKLEG